MKSISTARCSQRAGQRCSLVDPRSGLSPSRRLRDGSHRPHHGGGEDSLVVPGELDTQQFFGMPASAPAPARPRRLRARHGLRPRHLHAAQERARPQVDARDLASSSTRPARRTSSRRSSSSCILEALHRRRSSSSTSASLKHEPRRHASCIILLFSLVGIAGSCARRLVRHPREHLRELAHGVRRAQGQAVPRLRDPAQGRHEHRHAAHLVELVADARHPALHPAASYAGPCFIGFAIGESLGASALRIAGGIFTKIADIGSDLMKIVFKIKEDDARNPGVIADCTGDNAGDSVGPSRRRLRDLRRHRRRAHLVHPPRGPGPRPSRSSSSSGSS